MANVIRHIDIVHMTHTDVGFTDHPLVCRQQQVRYLDVAIDAVLATPTHHRTRNSIGRRRQRWRLTIGGASRWRAPERLPQRGR